MDLSAAQPLFEKLYREIAGYALSHSERNRHPSGETSVVYGEVVPASFHRALQAVSPQPGETFYDLGSGTGKAVFLAALCFDFSRLVGVELFSGLGGAARQVLARYDAEIRPLLPQGEHPRIDFIDADLRQVDVSDADVVFVHSVCYSPKLVSALALQLEGLRPGARVVSVGRRIASTTLAWQSGFPVDMEWGEAFAWLYRRR